MIIVGLGNPGTKYETTRHNVGWLVLDKLVSALKGDAWEKERGVMWSKIGMQILIKPQKFMNDSGPALYDFLKYKHLAQPFADMLVVHDDVDFPLGTVRIDVDRSSAGHRGVQSIIETLGTQNFRRLRLGIGDNRLANLPAEDYVLQNFSTAEQPTVATMLQTAVDRLVTEIKNTAG